MRQVKRGPNLEAGWEKNDEFQRVLGRLLATQRPATPRVILGVRVLLIHSK